MGRIRQGASLPFRLFILYPSAFILSPDVLPVPWLVVVRTEAEALGIADEPLVNPGVNLDGAVGVFRLDGFAADVEIQGAAREVRAINRETGAPRIRRLSAQPLLVFARPERGDDLRIL